MFYCAVCLEAIKRTQESIQCSACFKVLHTTFTCSKLDENDYGLLNNEWKCVECLRARRKSLLPQVSYRTPSPNKNHVSDYSSQHVIKQKESRNVKIEPYTSNLSVGDLSKTMKDLKSAIEVLASKFGEFTSEINVRDVEKPNLENKILSAAVTNLETKVNKLEQLSLQCKIEVVGIPQTQNENCKQLVNNIANRLDVDAPIITAYRDETTNHNQLKNIVAEFSSQDSIHAFMEAAKKNKNILASDLVAELPREPVFDTEAEIADIDDFLREEQNQELQKSVPCDTVSSPSTSILLPSNVPEKQKTTKKKFRKPSLVVKIKLTNEIKEILKNYETIQHKSEEVLVQNNESAKGDVNCDIKEEVINAKHRDNQQDSQKATNQAEELDIEEGEISSDSESDEGLKKDVKENLKINESNKPRKKLNLEEYRSRMKKMARSKTPDIKLDDNYEYKTQVVVPRENRNRRKIMYRRMSDSSSISSYSSRSRGSRARSTSKRSYRSSSRSRSRSRRSSRSYSSSSRSRSRSRNRRRSRRRSRSRSRGNYRRPRLEEWSPVDRLKQVEERRVVYVGKLPDGITKAYLRERFEQFGPISDITLHFRERNNNYGFVTFVSKSDAYFAVEHGNDKQDIKYDICFGGRRAFYSTPIYNQQQMKPISSYEQLLKKAQEKLKKKKV